jgi:cell shape-determining protein MreC
MRTIAYLTAALLIAIPAQAQQSKVAVIQSSHFNSLPDMAQALAQLDREFLGQSAELKRTSDTAVMLADEMEKLKATNAPQAALQAKRSELETVNLDYRRIQEDLEEKYTKRAEVVIAPVMLRIQQAMAKFFQGQGFTSVVDIDAGQSAPPEAADKTKDFMSWYQAQPRP